MVDPNVVSRTRTKEIESAFFARHAALRVDRAMIFLFLAPRRDVIWLDEDVSDMGRDLGSTHLSKPPPQHDLF